MKNKVLPSVVILFVSLGIFLGFSVVDDNPNSSRTQEPVQLETLTPNPLYVAPDAIIFEDSLNGANDTTALKSRGYLPFYRGAGPQGSSATWYQGISTVFPAFNGPSTGYVAANYNVVTGNNNIDSWLISPPVNVGASDTLSFYERAPSGSTYPDSMRIMYSAVGSTTPEGTWVELGRFKNTTTGSWFNRIYTFPTAGNGARFALRYCVVNGGPSGTNSNYIGVDWIRVYGSGGTPTSNILFKDDSLITIVGGGSGGADVSQISSGGTLYGTGVQQVHKNFIADDFIIPTGISWKIDSITFNVYQTGAPITGTITANSLRIRSGTVTGPSVFGDTLTNKMVGKYWSGIYRTTQTGLTSTSRAIMCVTDTLGGLVLPPGTYWAIAAFTGSLSSGPWMPPITIGNQGITGNGQQNQSGSWVAFTDNDGAKGVPMVIYGTTLTGITNPVNTPEKYELSQNYPNPFNPTTKINFSIPKSGFVTLKVFDVLGREIATLVNDTKVAGNYSVDFDGSRLSSGVYFYRIQAGDFISIKKMMLTK